MDAATTDVALLRNEIAALHKEITVLQAQRPAVGSSEDATSTAAPQANRRNFLKLAGAAAAGATAVAIAGSSHQAAANTSSPIEIGLATNFPTLITDVTKLHSPSSVNLMPGLFWANNETTTGTIALPTESRIAFAATVSGSDESSNANTSRTAVYGRSAAPTGTGGQGVFGSHNGVENGFAPSSSFGVVGTAEEGGYGVLGYNPTGTSSVGVIGRADFGVGVIASSFTGLSLLVRDGGRMQQQLRPTAGAPTAGSFSIGEQIRDANGDLYICTGSGGPGTWRKVNTQHPSYANAGGSINLLPRPIRLLDTRPTTAAPLNNGFAKISTTAVPLQITGTVADSLSVPAGAKGILGNITITGAVGAGYALVWSSDQTMPATSNINFGTADTANYFISAIDVTGKLKVLSSLPANVLIDVFGFVF